MAKAIKITKENLTRIEAETGIHPDSLQLLAASRDCFVVVGDEIIHGVQTYAQTIFRTLYSFVDGEDPYAFKEVIFK